MKGGREEMKGKALDILAGSDDDSDGPAEDNSKIQINEEFARRYEHNKRREAEQRLEEEKKKGLVADPDDEDDDSDDESDEDEAVAAASRRVDRRVLQVIRRIRSGDSAIFDKDAKVYSSSSEDEAEDGAQPKEGKAKKERPLYLKDVNAQHLLEEGPEFAAQTGRGSKYDRIAYDERQREGLKEFLEAEKKALGDGDGEEDDLFMAKQADGDAGDSEEDEDEKQTEELLGEVFGDDEELDDN